MKSDVIKFMQATGQYPEINTKDDFFKGLRDLYPKMLSEIDPELKDSIDLEYVIGVADDYADILVYLYQIESMLDRIGVDVVGVKQAVAENNSLKYTTSKALAERWLNEHDSNFAQFKQENPFYVSTNEYEGETYYCLKRISDDKVGKWVGFPKPALEKYVPKEYGGDL